MTVNPELRQSTIYDARRAGWLLAAGIAVGLLGGLILAWTWYQTGEGTSISVLGAGKQVSVLVTHEQRRVLFVSGTDGTAFSNAIAEALPPLGDEIDLMLISPEASADVIERARRLEYGKLMVLPEPGGTNTFETIDHSFEIALGQDIVVSVHVRKGDTWIATVDALGSSVVISPDRAVGTGDTASVWITLNGIPDSTQMPGAHVFMGAASSTDERLPNFAAVQSGEVARMTMEQSRISMPADLIVNRDQTSD